VTAEFAGLRFDLKNEKSRMKAQNFGGDPSRQFNPLTPHILLIVYHFFFSQGVDFFGSRFSLAFLFSVSSSS